MLELRREKCGTRATCLARSTRSPARPRPDIGVSEAGEGQFLAPRDHRRRSHGHLHCHTQSRDPNLCLFDHTFPIWDPQARPSRDLAG